ncbi:MAG TPA: endonuclease domain-containing protein [Stellaceae bacterium]|nr:endonuclease domain-containing protein [Stellaceae bacterium]
MRRRYDNRSYAPPPPLRGRVGRGVEVGTGLCHARTMAPSVARKLRACPTDAEIRLWSRLRRKQLEGCRFRRQQPLGPYVVDFFCPEAKLIIEVDGGQHAESTSDEKRTSWLEARGYRVMRFWNNDALGNTDGVLLKILEALRAGPPSLPSPSRGEGKGRAGVI